MIGRSEAVKMIAVYLKVLVWKDQYMFSEKGGSQSSTDSLFPFI